MKLTLVVAVVFGLSAAARPGACKTDKQVTGTCFTVHGRLSFYNGSPSTRIWVIGTHHMLGVPTEESEMPEYLRKLMTTFGDQVYGDFLVCPYKKAIPGHMQPVCIESARNLVHKQVE